MHAKAALERRLAVAEDVVSEADARLGKEFSAVVEERRAANGGRRVDHAVGESVVGGAALSLVPAVGGLEAEAGADFEAGRRFPGILDEAGAKERSPAK